MYTIWLGFNSFKVEKFFLVLKKLVKNTFNFISISVELSKSKNHVQVESEKKFLILTILWKFDHLTQATYIKNK